LEVGEQLENIFEKFFKENFVSRKFCFTLNFPSAYNNTFPKFQKNFLMKSEKHFKGRGSSQSIPICHRRPIENITKHKIQINTKTRNLQRLKKNNTKFWSAPNIFTSKEDTNAMKVLNSTKKIQEISISSRRSLDSFYQTLFGRERAWKILPKLIEALKRFPQLKSLNFELVCCPRLTKNPNFLCKWLRWSKFLKEFTLTIQTTKLTDTELKSLAQGFKSCAFLQRISLNFSNCYQISDFGLCYLSKGLKRLGSLKEVKFRFCNCQNISDKGLAELIKNLMGCEILRSQ